MAEHGSEDQFKTLPPDESNKGRKSHNEDKYQHNPSSEIKPLSNDLSISIPGRTIVLEDMNNGGKGASGSVVQSSEGQSDKSDDELIKMRIDAEKDYDKLVVYMNAGALALSVTFISDIIDISGAGSRGLLVASWVTHIVGLLSTLLSYLSAVRAIDFRISGKESEAQEINTRTVKLNKLALVSFILGVSLLVIFISINFAYVKKN